MAEFKRQMRAALRRGGRTFVDRGRPLRGRNRARGRAKLVAARHRFIANPRVGGFNDIERKFADHTTAYAATSLTWATAEDGTVLSISAVAQGDGENQRDGRVYHIDSIHVRGMIDVPVLEAQTAPLSDIVVRICVVLDSQTNAAQLTATDVMTAGSPEDTQGFRNLQHTSQFKVLMDETFVIKRDNQTNEGAVNAFATPRTMIPWSFDRKFKTPLKVICSGTTAVIGSITDNSIHVIAVSTDVTARIGHTSRVRFRG